MSRLENRVSVVTGAAQGIGAVYAKALAKEGSKIVVTDIDDCDAVAEEIQQTYQGTDVLSLNTDVSDEDSCNEMNKIDFL